MRIVVVVACLCGCVESAVTQCDGYVCPPNMACASTGCVQPEQLASCVDKSHNDPCTYGAQVGHCIDGVCRPVGCGNSFVTGAETCDDGNTVNGDGCSADCLSNETCANRYTDIARGETCDDGGRESQDGCSSTCLREVPIWTPRRPGPPPPRAIPALAYDARRGVVVMFGGAASGPDIADTWEWNGVHWTERAPAVSPPRRNSASAAYDARRGVVVVFGGDDANVVLADTWEYDGNEWIRRALPVSPSPRQNAAMAYDAGRGVVVLFGGRGPAPSAELADTWEYDGVTWKQVTSATSPPAREAAAVAYDPARGDVVLFGGRTSNSAVFLADTWTWDGATWTLATPPAAPPPRALHVLAWSARHGALVLAGGNTGSTAAPVSVYPDTWSWDGTTWTVVTANAGPSLWAASAVFDVARDQIVLFGGRDVNASYESSTRTFTDQWETRTAIAQPGARSHVASAWDARTGRVVMYGGRAATGATDETWEWDGAGWSTAAGNRPPAREGAKLAYDHARDKLVMYGRIADQHETWTRSGGTWTLQPASGPTGWPDSAVAYDAEHEVCVLFDGRTIDAASGRTFLWNGATWTRATVSGPPPIDGALAYDARRQRIVLFGRPAAAMQPASGENQTWEWDGDVQAWSEVPTTFRPIPRLDHALVYDPVRQRTVMFGGFESTNLFVDFGDTWEWDGTTWRDISPSQAPSPRYAVAAAYDQARRELVVFGGAQSSSTRFDDTWALRYQATVLSNDVATYAPDETCSYGFDADRDGLLGCDDPDCAAHCARCGDDTCDPLESCRTCPADCGMCALRCGDFVCDAAEACAGDCAVMTTAP